ncbi:MAG: S-methyl-5-thioribose-1-phosphate isomerase [archaeon]
MPLSKVRETAKRIKEMKIQGAVSISLAAAQAMEHFIKSSKAKTRKEFIAKLEEAASILIDSRPSAVALPNAVREYVAKVSEIEAEPPKLKKEALRIGRALVKEITESVDIIGKFGAVEVKDGMNILIHCHSSTVMAVLKQAWRNGKRFEVYCTETRPWGQGYVSASELSNYGIPTRLIVDSAATRFMQQGIDLVLVGADTVTKEKSVVNKIGTSQLAIVAQKLKIPFYVATETLKFDSSRTADEVEIEERPADEIIRRDQLPNVKIRNPVFDITPAERIHRFITEDGVLQPGEIDI